jgi:hypothetical protein
MVQPISGLDSLTEEQLSGDVFEIQEFFFFSFFFFVMIARHTGIPLFWSYIAS